MPPKLPTTVIGSFPKPGYLPIRDWFDSARDNGTMDSPSVTRGYTGYTISDADEALFVRAAEEVNGLQVAAKPGGRLAGKGRDQIAGIIAKNCHAASSFTSPCRAIYGHPGRRPSGWHPACPDPARPAAQGR